jgi:hypothetical protein
MHPLAQTAEPLPADAAVRNYAKGSCTYCTASAPLSS